MCAFHTLVTYLFVTLLTHYVSHQDAIANNAIKTNNYNWKATLTMTNTNIYWTVHYATIYLLNLKHI